MFRRLRVRVKAPARLAGIGINGGHHVKRRTGIQRIANLQRRIFVNANGRAGQAAACVVGPCNFQLMNVFRGNICIRRKTGAGGIAAEEFPVIAFAACVALLPFAAFTTPLWMPPCG